MKYSRIMRLMVVPFAEAYARASCTTVGGIDNVMLIWLNLPTSIFNVIIYVYVEGFKCAAEKQASPGASAFLTHAF